MSHMLALSCLLLLAACAPSAPEPWDKCKLARKLQNFFPSNQISTWICIIYHESRYDQYAIRNDIHGNDDYGLFQINSRYWCDKGTAGCGVSCTKLLESVKASVKCAKKIYKAQSKGFRAWTVYAQHCRGDTSHWTRDC